MAVDISPIPEDYLAEKFTVPPELRPKVDRLVVENDEPVDNLVSEKHMRLLVESLYDSWPGPGGGGPFVAMANVGLFMTDHEDPIVPDVLVSLGVRLPADWRSFDKRSYFVWVFGKVPDLALEIVSPKVRGEDTTKLQAYAQRGIPYYVVFDPENRLGGGELRAWCLHGRTYRPISPAWIPEIELGLTFWEGSFEHETGRWLRWCDQHGQVLLTGHERAEQACQRAEQERQRAEQERQRAEQERQRAEQERQRAQAQALRLAQLEQWLRERGLEPPV